MKKLKLSETKGMLHKIAKAMLDAHGEYVCVIDGVRTEIVK